MRVFDDSDKFKRIDRGKANNNIKSNQTVGEMKT